MTTATVYNVTGYYADETPDDLLTVCMFSGDNAIEDLGGFTDDDIFFYGVSGESLDAAIRDKEDLGGFIPTSWEINSTITFEEEEA